MEAELNRKYNVDYYDINFYNFEGQPRDDSPLLSLKEFLLSHRKSFFEFVQQQSLPTSFKSQLTEENLLGKGAFGEVFLLILLGKQFALKKLIEHDLYSFSTLFKELSFCLKLNKKMPLLSIEQIFLEKDKQKNEY